LRNIGTVDKVFYFISAVIDNNPFDAILGISLITETIEHVLDKRTAIECGCANRHHRQIFVGHGILFVVEIPLYSVLSLFIISK
jgi:hypothetical protein